MASVYNFLFPQHPEGTVYSIFLLALRIIFGMLLLLHGMEKWTHFASLSSTFPDPLGIGTPFSLCLVIFAEVICSLGFMFGLLYRLVLIPMIITMAVAFFVIHGAQAFAEKELAFIYLVVFVLMYMTGPGKYSVDRWIAVSLSGK